MKRALNIILCSMILVFIFGCVTSHHTVSDPNIGNIEIEIMVVTGKDSLARTPDGTVIGRIDKEGNIYDLGGNKIGKRKPTDEELIMQFAY